MLYMFEKMARHLDGRPQLPKGSDPMVRLFVGKWETTTRSSFNRSAMDERTWLDNAGNPHRPRCTWRNDTTA